MELHGSDLRIGVHIYVENVEILLKAEHLSLHIFGHVNNFPEHQELHLWNLDGNLLHHRNVHHSEDELNLGQDSNLWTVGTVAADLRDVDAKNSLLHKFALCVPSLSTTEMSSTLSMNCPCTPWTAGT